MFKGKVVEAIQGMSGQLALLQQDVDIRDKRADMADIQIDVTGQQVTLVKEQLTNIRDKVKRLGHVEDDVGDLRSEFDDLRERFEQIIPADTPARRNRSVTHRNAQRKSVNKKPSTTTTKRLTHAIKTLGTPITKKQRSPAVPPSGRQLEPPMVPRVMFEEEGVDAPFFNVHAVTVIPQHVPVVPVLQNLQEERDTMLAAVDAANKVIAALEAVGDMDSADMVRQGTKALTGKLATLESQLIQILTLK